MGSKSFINRKLVFGLMFLFVIGCLAQEAFASTISGFVYDKQRNALKDVEMELLTEYYSLKARTRTDAAGRYSFGGLTDGRYTVRALPLRYDYDDEEIMVEIVTFKVRGEGVGNALIIQDFYLSPKKGGIAEAEIGVIFAQKVPDDAREAYKKALKDFASKRQQEGVDGLNIAINIYPEYFDALYRMGKELFIAGKYEQSWRYFFESTKVNEKSGPSFYYMGYCFYKLGKDYEKAAITSLSRATELNPGAVQIFLTLGMVERLAGKFADAEQHLIQAKKLASKPVAQVHKELAALYGNDLKKYDEAADELELYLKSGKMSNEDEKSTKAAIQHLRQKAKAQAVNGNS